MKSPSESSIYICSIVRNAERGLKRNIPLVEKLFNEFKSVKVFVYENDSTDNTKKLLQHWAESYPDIVEVSIQDNLQIPTVYETRSDVNSLFCGKRIEKMVFLRNKYLEHIAQSGWNGDYLMVIDLDICKFDPKTVLESFNTQVDWDAISAYGYSLSPKLKERYHDTYAYRPFQTLYDTPQTERDIYDCQNDFTISKEHGVLMRVASAFGGLAIYQWQAVKDLRYQLEPNHDSRVEVYCEHRSLYRQMFERGFTKFYINPKMRIKYQELSVSLILQWVKSKMGRQ